MRATDEKNAAEQLASLFSIPQTQKLDKREQCWFEFSPMGRDFTLVDEFTSEVLCSSLRKP